VANAAHRGAWGLAVVGLLCAASPARPADSGTARIVGSLRFRDRDRAMTPAEAERRVDGRRISIAFRRGWEVAVARLEGDGRFTADVAPGTWRLEWIDVGDRAEVLGTPLEVAARAGAPTCAGRIEIRFGDVESELGASAGGAVEVTGGCDTSGSAAGSPAAARPGGELYEPPAGLQEALEGLRVAGAYTAEEPGLRVSMAIPLRRPIAWMGNVVLVAGAARRFASDGARDAWDLGAGFVPYWGAELSGGASWLDGGGGASPWAALRLGPAPYAFVARVDLRDGAAWTFGLELSAFHLVGRFL
jgi:hypothetical protein